MTGSKEIILCGRALILPTTIELSIDDNENFATHKFSTLEPEEIYSIPVALNYCGIRRVEIKTIEGSAELTQTRAKINEESHMMRLSKFNFYCDGIKTPMQDESEDPVGDWWCLIPRTLFFELSIGLNH